MGEFDNAEDYYKKALNIEFDIYAILGLALINKGRGNYREALESLSSLLRNDSKNHRLYTEIADCYIKLGQKDKALETLMQYQRQGLRNPYVSAMLENLK